MSTETYSIKLGCEMDSMDSLEVGVNRDGSLEVDIRYDYENETYTVILDKTKAMMLRDFLNEKYPNN